MNFFLYSLGKEKSSLNEIDENERLEQIFEPKQRYFKP